MRSLIGIWSSDPSDATTQKLFGAVSLIFRADGSLDYIIHESSGEQIIKLTYVVRDGLLITDQPSHPRKEETPFQLEDENCLILVHAEGNGRFTRVPRENVIVY